MHSTQLKVFKKLAIYETIWSNIEWQK